MKAKLLTLDYKFIEEVELTNSSLNSLEPNFVGIVDFWFGMKCWVYNKKLHNLKGHVLEWNGGDYEYYIHGIKCTSITSQNDGA